MGMDGSDTTEYPLRVAGSGASDGQNGNIEFEHVAH
jgi:hypothetical protein